MTQAVYDANICAMEWPDGKWFWMQSASYCSPSALSSGMDCTWNFQQDFQNPKTPIPIPSNYSLSNTYTCDNQLHDLKWSETSLTKNRYICACGQALSNNTHCEGICDIPWTASFDKRCNVVTRVAARGNFSSYGGTQGTCLRGAGQRNVDLSTPDPVDVPVANLKSGDILVVDGFGLTQACSNDNQDRGDGRICNCDGALPEMAWGQKVAIRDACGIDKSADKAWIAAPVVGGVALLAFISILLFLFVRRRDRKKFTLQDQVDIALESMDNLRQEASNLDGISPISSIPGANVPSVGSENTVESFDSGVALIQDPPCK